MYGAIIGDIVGSYYEVLEIKNKNRSYEDRMKIMDRNVPLFNEKCSCTDDSILTTAIANAILNGESYEKKLREYGLREINLGKDIYGRSRFGKGFVEWLKNDYMGESFGNGSAMRISPVGYLFNSIDEIKSESLNATIPSHNHIESIKSSEAVAVSIYLLRRGMDKDSLKEYIEKHYFSLEYDLDDLRKNYKFTSRAIDSVPQAIFCFLNSNDFEDAIRLSISIGGDSDTIACITGALAESYYGIDEEIIECAKTYIKDYMKDVIDKFYSTINNKNNILVKKNTN